MHHGAKKQNMDRPLDGNIKVGDVVEDKVHKGFVAFFADELDERF